MAGPPTPNVDELVRDYGRDLLAAAPPPASFAGPSIDEDIARTRFGLQEQIAALRYAVRNNDYSDKEIDVADPMPELRAKTVHLAQQSGLDLAGLDPGHSTKLHQGVARAMIEERLQFLHRMDDPFASYQPSDYLFADAKPKVDTSSVTNSVAFHDAANLYTKAKTGVAWTPRTEQENRRLLNIAAQHFGAATPISEISQDDVRKFRDDLLTWRKKPSPTAKLVDLVGAPAGKQISAVTAAKYFGYITSAFNHWVDEGHLAKSPIGKISVVVGKAKLAGARQPFTNTDLARLFGSPMYQGCAGPMRRMTPGDQVIKDGFYWVPLIGTLSGMRVTEIVQLQLNDVDAAGVHPTFRVKADASLGQSVKTAAGYRNVPIHRRLIELGFVDFYAERRDQTAKGRLFFDVPFAKTGGGGGEFSKWFGRRMRDLKLHRPGLVFHSFRHRFIDELREHGAPSYVIKAIVGHEGGDTTDKYGSKPSIPLCREWIDKIGILDALPPDEEAWSPAP